MDELLNSSEGLNRRRCIILGEIAERAGRYRDALSCSRRAISKRFGTTSSMRSGTATEEEHGECLNPKDRKRLRLLLALAYRRIVEKHRRALELSKTMFRKGGDKGLGGPKDHARDLLLKVCTDLDKDLSDMERIVALHAIPGNQRIEARSEVGAREKVEATVFWSKMLGDCYRYRSEIQEDGERRRRTLDVAAEHYERASDEASRSLKPTSSLRLGLAVNYASLLADASGDKKQAIRVARAAWEDATAERHERTPKIIGKLLSFLNEKIREWEAFSTTTTTTPGGRGHETT